MAQLLAYLGVLLGVAGVSAPTTDAVKAIAAAAIPVVISVYQWQHHRTIRNADKQAAAIRTAAATVQANATVDKTAAAVALLTKRVSSLEQLSPLPVGPAPAAPSVPPTPPAPTQGAPNGGPAA